MEDGRSPTLRVRVRGPLACFTRPELKVERVSYPMITPSAARGVLEAVLWKPAIRWHIERIHLLSEIQFSSFRRNEVCRKASLATKRVVAEGGEIDHYFSDEDRAQRNTVALKDVDYLIEAHFVMTERCGSEDNVNKFVSMFNRRVEKGQHFHQPYLGCREFIAEVLPPDPLPPTVNETRDLGLMLWDIEFGRKGNRPIFFPASLKQGVLDVPDAPSVRNSAKEAS